MALASTFYPFDRENVFCDPEGWDAMFEALLDKNPEFADSLGRLLCETVGVIRQDGVERTVNTLKVGIEWLFQHASVRGPCFTLFLYQIEGLLDDDDLPAELIGGAIEGADAAERRFADRMRSGNVEFKNLK